MLFLAIRHLLSRRKQTILIILGICMGVGAYVIISSAMLGMREFLIRQIINNEAHIKISAREEALSVEEVQNSLYKNNETVFWLKKPSGFRGSQHIEYVQGWFDRLNQDPRVLSYTPHLTAQVLVRHGGLSRTGQIIGTVPSKQVRITNISDNMKEGKFEDIGQSGSRIVVGDGLLEDIGAQVGDTVFLTSGKSQPTPFKIVGSFHFGLPHTDRMTIFGSLADVQKINNTPGRVNDISIQVTNVDIARAIAEEWKMLGHDKVESWDEINAQFLQVFQVQDLIRYLVTSIMLVVASFGIYNVLTIIVNQKRREIAILRSIGYDSHDITRLFFIQGMILGFAGGVIGMLIGLSASLYISTLSVSQSRMSMGGKFPVSFNPSIYLIGYTMALIASATASILPARSAGKMTPIDIIRSEQG